MRPSPRTGPIIGAGIALIVLPVLAILIKSLVYSGWMMLFIVMSGIVLVAGFAVQVVIAVSGMLRPTGVFRTSSGALRGVIAAWVTAVSVLLAACFLVDGGDDGTYGSLFTVITGTSSTVVGQDLSTIFFLVFAVAWILGWIWLVVEWIVLLVRARRVLR